MTEEIPTLYREKEGEGASFCVWRKAVDNAHEKFSHDNHTFSEAAERGITLTRYCIATLLPQVIIPSLASYYHARVNLRSTRPIHRTNR